MRSFCFFIGLFLLFSCSERKPFGVLSDEEMEDVLVDYHIALAIAEVQPGDMQENRYILTQKALKKHDVTEAEFDSSLVYWCKNAEKFVKICENVSERINFLAETQGVERQEKNTRKVFATEGDTANVWNMRKGVVLIPNMVDNIYSFTLDADSTYLPGDNFVWAFNSQFLCSDRYTEAFLLFSIEYENDSVIGTSQRVHYSKYTEIRLNCPSKFKNIPIRSIRGTMYLPLRQKGFGILALQNFVLVRYHDLTKKKQENQEIKEEEKIDTPVVKKEEKDTNRVRQNPYDIRKEQDDEKTIKIVRDKPVRTVSNRR